MCAVRPTLQRVQLWNKAVAKVLIKIMKDFVKNDISYHYGVFSLFHKTNNLANWFAFV